MTRVSRRRREALVIVAVYVMASGRLQVQVGTCNSNNSRGSEEMPIPPKLRFWSGSSTYASEESPEWSTNSCPRRVLVSRSVFGILTNSLHQVRAV